MADRFQETTVFVRAAETGSFSRAARELGLSQPSVSRIVADLEVRLGVKLLLRTTRRVVPTEAGAIFLARSRQALAEMEEAEDAARGADSLRGTLHVAMPVTFGVRVVIPALPAFLAAHPLLRVQLMMAETRQDLVTEGADLALRFGPLPDSAFGARRLASTPRMVVASPGYLAARGTPAVLADLAAHDCVFGPGGTARANWVFRRDGAVASVEVDGRIQVASAEGVIACVKAGLGIAVASGWMCAPELAQGSLVRVLPHHLLEPADVYAVFPAGRTPSLKTRVFADYVARVLAG
jgi:DNA-binding transcriptional LysR family regulator